MRLSATVAALAPLVTHLAAQWVHYRTPGIPRTANREPNLSASTPRTADGKPDLNGLWDMFGNTEVGSVAVRKAGDLKPGDVQPWAQALIQQRAESFGKDNPHYPLKCLPEGPNYTTNGGMKRILQTPAIIAILNEDQTTLTDVQANLAIDTSRLPNLRPQRLIGIGAPSGGSGNDCHGILISICYKTSRLSAV